MADGGGFEGRVGFVDENLRAAAARSRDIAKNLEHAVKAFAGFERRAATAAAKMSDIAKKMERLNELGRKTDFDRLGRQFRWLAAQKHGLRFLDAMDKGFTKIIGGIAKLGSGIISTTFSFLISSIKRVYELQERWTRAIGGFNMRIGGMTAGLRQAQRAATQWSSTIRGLTGGDIFEGIQMFEDFTMAMSRVVRQGDEFSRFGMQLARGFNLSGQGGGKLARTFEDMGSTVGDAARTMSELIDAANLVSVPVNQLAEDVAEANTYMARFGKEGAKSFVTAAGYARKFAMSMRELQAATEKFDLFDDAATTAAKLNTTFGTLINSVDLMLMDDPAQRMEYIRQSLMAQGKTYDTLSVKERRYAAETMGVNEQQLASLLKLENARFSYQDMIEKQRKEEAKEADAKKRMEKQLRATAQTMYAFGAAFDRITVAIANAIRPLLEVLGLAKSGGKDFKSFGQVMESVTKHTIHFFNSLAENPKWILFMRDLAGGMKDVASAIGSFIMDGRAAKWAGEVAGALHQVYSYGKSAFSFMLDAAKALEPVLRFVLKHIKEIAVVWGAWQAVKFGADAVGAVRNVRDRFMGPRWNRAAVGQRGGRDAAGMMIRVGGSIGAMETGGIIPESDWLSSYETRRASIKVRRPMTGRRIAGLAGGAALGGIGAAILTGRDGGVGAGVGTGLGTLVGSIFGGPLGAAIGGALGGFLGEKVGGWMKSLFGRGKTESEKSLDAARDNLRSAMESMEEQTRRQNKLLEIAAARLALEDARRTAISNTINRLDQQAIKTKGKNNQLTEEEASRVSARIGELNRFGMGTKATAAMMDSLAKSGELTDQQIKLLADMSKKYEEELGRLRDTTSQRVAQEMAAIQTSHEALKVQGLEIQAKEIEHKISEEKTRLKRLETGQLEHGVTHRKDFKESKLGIQHAVTIDPAVKKRLEKEFAIQKQKEKLQGLEAKLLNLQADAVKQNTNLSKKLFLIQVRGLIMSETRFIEFQKQAAAAGIKDQSVVFSNFLLQNKDEFKKIYGEHYEALVSGKFAAGGVVSRPTVALIGEAGPEAVVPLRALARGKGPRGSAALGGSVGRTIANMATGGGKSNSGTTVHVVSSDVVLDGTKVGRAITRVAISSPEA